MSKIYGILEKYNKKNGKFSGKVNYDEINASGNYAQLIVDQRIIETESKGLSFLERFDVEKTISKIERKKLWNSRHPNFNCGDIRKLIKELY